MLSKFYTTETGKYCFPTNTPSCGVRYEMVENNKWFDKPIVESLVPYITKGSTVIDLGACFGQMSVYFSNVLQKLGGGTVVTVEASELSFASVEANIEANKCPDVVNKLYHNAVWHVSGKKVALHQPLNQNKSNAHLAVNVNAKGEEKIIDTLAIDDLNLENVSAMKVDVQGSDLKAMQGARETIKRTQMRIVFEFENPDISKELGSSFSEYLKFIESIEYEIKKEVLPLNFLIGPKHNG